MGVGDVDHDGEGEVSICDFQGNVLLLDRSGDGFKSSTIWSEPGPPTMSKTLHEIRVGDILLDKEGPEIIVGGNSRNLTVLYYEGGQWFSEVIYESPVQIWSMGIGDFDTESPGEEIFLASWEESKDDRVLRYLKRSGGNQWVEEDIQMPHTVKAVEIVDADPSVPGKEAWVTTSAQTQDPVSGGEYTLSLLLEVYKEGGEWTYEQVDSNIGKLIANVEGGDIWTGHPGNELITVDFNGNCTIYWEEGGNFLKEVVFKATDDLGNYALLEGLVVGDFNPLKEGDEALVTGYYNDVTQIIDMDGTITADLAWEKDLIDPNLEISGINVGDVLPDVPGNEFIVGSRQGWVEVVNFERDGFDLEVQDTVVQMFEDTTRDVEASIIPRGYLRGLANISFEGDVDLWVAAPSNKQVDDHDPVDFKFSITANSIDTARETYTFSLVVEMEGMEKSVDIQVTILGQNIESSLDLLPSTGVVYKEIGQSFKSKATLRYWGEMEAVDVEVEHPSYLMVTYDDPIPSGGSSIIRISPLDNAVLGSTKVTVHTFYQGEEVASGEISLLIYSLQEWFTAELRDEGENHYAADLRFTGPASVSNLTVVLKIDGNTMLSVEEGFLVGEVNSYNITTSDENRGMVTVELRNPADQVIATFELGEVEYQKDEGNRTLTYIFMVLVIILVIVILLVAIFYKPKDKEKDESLIGIGSPTRYHPESGMGRERRPRGRAEPDRRRVVGPSRRGPDRGPSSMRSRREPKKRESARGGSLRGSLSRGREKEDERGRRAPPPRFR